MARINLLTIHYGQCYGAVMQTYATCRLLGQHGHTVRVINLINPKQKDNWKRLSFWKGCIREFQFWLFKKKYFSKLTNKSYSIDDIVLPEADITIVGSDQVWNRDITGEFGNTFFLDFVKGQKKIALSSSFGKSSWIEQEQYTSEIKALLSEFSVISVRESSGIKILKDIFNLNAYNLLDPTLGYAEFDDLVLNNKRNRQIFPFLLLNNAAAKERTTYIANELGLHVYKYNFFTSRFMNGPRYWITRIKNSEFIITDSFHGLAFSLIFNKQFFVFCASEAKFTRLKSLLELLSLEGRYVSSIDDFMLRKDELMKPIDYTYVNSVLKQHKEIWLKFINEYITVSEKTQDR